MSEDITNGEDKEVKEVTLSDSNFSLLKEFREKAPGSYKHTQTLAGIIENVGAAIDLEPKKIKYMKLGALYHDIGKMWAPDYFSENQPPDSNSHDGLDPITSFHLITRHVSDSVYILTINDFPTEVIKLVGQHHGNTVLKAIYEKAKKLDKKVDKDLFRYNTEKPCSLEAMILMLCDQIEAASRSIFTQNDEITPEDFVMSAYNRLLMDGQFDDVAVKKLGYINKIQKALIIDVAAMFHKRVSYENEETES